VGSAPIQAGMGMGVPAMRARKPPAQHPSVQIADSAGRRSGREV